MAGPSKRVRFGDKHFEETLQKWYDEVDSDASDIDNVPEDKFDNSDHDSASEQSEDSDDGEGDSDDEPLINRVKYFYGKNRCRWCKTEVRPSSRTRKHNIVIKVPVLKARAQRIGTKADPLSVWQLLFSDEIMDTVIRWTNKRLAKIRSEHTNQNKTELKDLDIIELKAFIGCLVYTSVFNSNHENLDTLFATDGTERVVFRAVMSRERFGVLLSSLRFDNPEDRDLRKNENPAAAILEIFEQFIHNCQDCYGIGSYACIDEMLVSFRGRCPFKVYMPNKPDKYGIKIMCLTDARTSYLYNAYVYCGRDTDGIGLLPEEKRFSKPTQSVIRLAKPLFNTRRNITADNWFSSVELAELLFSKGLTYVGTLRKNKRDIPNEFLPNRKKEVGSTAYGFKENLTMISHVSHKGKATILISSMHNRIFKDPESNKPEIVEFYNNTKGGVDCLDEKCAKSSTSRRTRRWPMAIFFRMIDISIVNAYILHQSYKDNPNIPYKSPFAKQLAKQLVEEHMKRRAADKHISREVRNNIRRIIEIPEEVDQVDYNEYVLEKRKLCHLCPRKRNRMTKYLCFECKRPVCLQCTKPVCVNCTEKR